jgi:hypothetical protein
MKRFLIRCAVGMGLLGGTFAPASAHYYHHRYCHHTIITAGGVMVTATVIGTDALDTRHIRSLTMQRLRVVGFLVGSNCSGCET